ncbi:hypothetical protein QUF95_09855 [Paenibacillus silvae]|uniref:hypothetical protein n=1 Tax=Paenibacillus silvae TaxID=1325358 RepID=UPI0025A0EBBC|nr:hypothetical protein [Paenibacillus silvae]MDM5277687.1 hypothetical protein [Paenibacillus silvae]
MKVWKIRLIRLLSVCLVISSFGAVSTTQAAGEQVEVWISTADPHTEPAVGLRSDARLTRIASQHFDNASANAEVTITVNENRTFQQMDGFGVFICLADELQAGCKQAGRDNGKAFWTYGHWA